MGRRVPAPPVDRDAHAGDLRGRHRRGRSRPEETPLDGHVAAGDLDAHRAEQRLQQRPQRQQRQQTEDRAHDRAGHPRRQERDAHRDADTDEKKKRRRQRRAEAPQRREVELRPAAPGVADADDRRAQPDFERLVVAGREDLLIRHARLEGLRRRTEDGHLEDGVVIDARDLGQHAQAPEPPVPGVGPVGRTRVSGDLERDGDAGKTWIAREQVRPRHVHILPGHALGRLALLAPPRGDGVDALKRDAKSIGRRERAADDDQPPQRRARRAGNGVHLEDRNAVPAPAFREPNGPDEHAQPDQRKHQRDQEPVMPRPKLPRRGEQHRHRDHVHEKAGDPDRQRRPTRLGPDAPVGPVGVFRPGPVRILAAGARLDDPCLAQPQEDHADAGENEDESEGQHEQRGRRVPSEERRGHHEQTRAQKRQAENDQKAAAPAFHSSASNRRHAARSRAGETVGRNRATARVSHAPSTSTRRISRARAAVSPYRK